MSLLNKLILHDWEKYYTCLDWCLITWQNNEDLHEKKFTDSVGVWAALRVLVEKTSGKIKNQLEINLWRKKRILHKTFCSMQNFLELQCLIDDLVDFLELSVFVNASLP